MGLIFRNKQEKDGKSQVGNKEDQKKRSGAFT